MNKAHFRQLNGILITIGCSIATTGVVGLSQVSRLVGLSCSLPPTTGILQAVVRPPTSAWPDAFTANSGTLRRTCDARTYG